MLESRSLTGAMRPDNCNNPRAAALDVPLDFVFQRALAIAGGDARLDHCALRNNHDRPSRFGLFYGFWLSRINSRNLAQPDLRGLEYKRRHTLNDKRELSAKAIAPYPIELAPADSVDPVIEVYKKKVDRALLRENLKLTVEQRFEKVRQALLKERRKLEGF